MTPHTFESYPQDKTAIILVDPYNDFVSMLGQAWPLVSKVARKVRVVKHLQAILSVARRHNIQIAYAPHIRYQKGIFADRKYLSPTQFLQSRNGTFAKDKFGGRFHRQFTPQEGDLIASEHTCSSGFAETDLHDMLSERGITHVIIIGYLSNTCIEATARSAVDLDYHVTLVTDAVAAFSPKDHEAAIAHTYQLLAHVVTTTAQLVDRLGVQDV